MEMERIKELLNSCVDWIYEHTEAYGDEEFINALHNIGMTDDEIEEFYSI